MIVAPTVAKGNEQAAVASTKPTSVGKKHKSKQGKQEAAKARKPPAKSWAKKRTTETVQKPKSSSNGTQQRRQLHAHIQTHALIVTKRRSSVGDGAVNVGAIAFGAKQQWR